MKILTYLAVGLQSLPGQSGVHNPTLHLDNSMHLTFIQTNARKFRMAWPLLILLLLPALARAERAVQAWVQTYNGPGSGAANMDCPAAVAVDGSNNVVVTGYSMGSGTYNDYVTIKYSSAGAPLWTNRYNGPAGGTDSASALAVDSGNNVIVTGFSDAGGETRYDYATIKYSSDGVPLWTNRYNGSLNGGDRACAIAIDRSNNVIVTGWSPGIGTGADYATIKYSSDGVPLWTNLYNGTGSCDDLAAGVAVDANNDVIVTGSSFSSAMITSSDYATIKYSSEGVPLWTNLYNGPGNSMDEPRAVAVDANNDVLVTGRSDGGAEAGYFGYATIKYSSAGVPLWTNRYPKGSPWALAVDRGNNVVVTGSSAGNCATIEYSAAGLPLWTNLYKEPWDNYSEALAVAADGNNNVIVTGYSATTNVSPYNKDYATIKYSAAGAPLWTNRYKGPGNGDDAACALAVDHSGNVIVTGSATGSGGVNYATIKYICVPSPVLTCLQPANGWFRLRIDDVLQPGTLVIEATTNLTFWAPVFTNVTPTNVLFYTEPALDGTPVRFYRTYQFP